MDVAADHDPSGIAVAVDEETERLLAAQRARRERLADLEVEREALRADLARFSHRYHARVGVLLVEQSRLTLAIREYVRRIELLRQMGSQGDPQAVEAAIAEEFRQSRREVEEDAAEAEEARAAHAVEREAESRWTREEQEARRQRLKALYREQARLYHPDHARSEQDRARWTRHMAAVNSAYHAGDLEQLERLAAAAPGAEKAPREETAAGRRRRLREQIASLDRVIERVITDIAALKASPAYRLWQDALAAEAAGRDYLAELASAAQREIAALREELEELIAIFRDLAFQTYHR